MRMTTWAKELHDVRKRLEDNTMMNVWGIYPKEMEKEFDDGHGIVNGQPFLAYSEKFIYFCVAYDGSEWLEYAPVSFAQAVAMDWKSRHYGG